MTTVSVFMTILTIVCYGRKNFFGQISIILVRYVICIDLHRMCCAASLLFFLKHKYLKIARFPKTDKKKILRCFREKNTRCKGPKGDNDWSTWPSKRPRNSNTTSSASVYPGEKKTWNLCLRMRNKHSSTVKTTFICFNRVGDFTEVQHNYFLYN